jgi:hypothetical protein
MENRNGLVVDHRLGITSGTAEPENAVGMVRAIPGTQRVTLGVDKGYDRSGCVSELRQLNATVHATRRKVGSAIDGRTARPDFEESRVWNGDSPWP